MYLIYIINLVFDLYYELDILTFVGSFVFYKKDKKM